ncbi:MAG: DsbA family protein [Novosphingobium sp.]|nr:DsbA family protein [Novosphingobium sp.]MCP5401968.1 DsbA family protein [Novosphingobium sp.]
MNSGPPVPGKRVLPAIIGAVLLLAGVAGGWFWHAARTKADPASALDAGDRAAIEQVVHDYILENPEILPQAMENLRLRENSERLASIRDDVQAPYPGAVLGNPEGKVTLVEFTDFACGYCRQSVADVEQLIAANPDLRIVIRELPILSPQSADAARWALAAADQGKYAAFHHAMFAAGRPGPETIQAAARAAGLDMERAKAALSSPRIAAELDRNFEFARQLGFEGTPSWISGDQLLSGAVGKDVLADAIVKARR